MIKIRRLLIEDIRCFERADLDFTAAGKAATWVMLLGDNGTGKSTVLRCIALALASPVEAVRLMESKARRETPDDEALGGWVRLGAERGRIQLTIEVDGAVTLIVRTIRRTPQGDEIAMDEPYLPSNDVTSYVKQRGLMCGYGAMRSMVSTAGHGRYSLSRSMESLFDPTAKLQSPELILWRQSSARGGAQRLLRRIEAILLLPKGAVQLGDEGLTVRGPWGFHAGVGALSDGYRATLAWVLDMIGWALAKDAAAFETAMEGIVLVDEIEQHLHPSWQRRIVAHLSRQFPQIQFIVTTHAPLCVTGTTDLSDDKVAIGLLQWNERQARGVAAISGIRPPRGQRADQILTSYLFGLSTTEDDQTKWQVHRLAKLLERQSKAPEVEAEIERLERQLERSLGQRETMLEDVAAEVLEKVLHQSLREALRKGTAAVGLPAQAVSYEVRRQLRDLLLRSEEE